MSESTPSGTVTFVFTDIEGSTPLWDSFPDAMGAALARHDEILRSAIGANGGHVFSTAGDGVGPPKIRQHLGQLTSVAR